MLEKQIEALALKFATEKIQKALKDELNINICAAKLPSPNPQKSYMLYAHVPFCHTFCPYCSFHKYHYDEQKAKIYFEDLRSQMVKVKELGYDFSTMYVGGGTTLINEPELEKTLILAKKLFNITQISCESDPSHINDLERFKGLIDRLSVGVQSFDDEILRKIGRFEKFGSGEAVRDKLEKIAQILPALSVDLIFNFPNQSKESLLNDIKMAKSTNAAQFTFYPLMKSNLTKDSIAKSLGVSLKDNEREFYELICKNMDGYEQGNVWSFSKKDKTAIKDEYVSAFSEYLGLGSGAFSFLDGKLLINAFNLDNYSQRANSGASCVIASCEFSKKNRALYLLLTQLFDIKMNFKDFCAQNNIDKNDLSLILLLLKISKVITQNGDEITLSAFGRYLVLVMMKEFYIGMDKLRAIFGTKSFKSGQINIIKESV